MEAVAVAEKDEEPEVEPPNLSRCHAQWPGHCHLGPREPPQNWCSHVQTLDSSTREMNHPLEHPSRSEARNQRDDSTFIKAFR